jgi:hypothetical protein
MLICRAGDHAGEPGSGHWSAGNASAAVVVVPEAEIFNPSVKSRLIGGTDPSARVQGAFDVQAAQARLPIPTRTAKLRMRTICQHMVAGDRHQTLRRAWPVRQVCLDYRLKPAVRSPGLGGGSNAPQKGWAFACFLPLFQCRVLASPPHPGSHRARRHDLQTHRDGLARWRRAFGQDKVRRSRKIAPRSPRRRAVLTRGGVCARGA